MKKIILLSVLALILGMSAQGQEKLKFGITAGAKLSTLYGEHASEDLKPLIGYQAGGILTIPIVPNFQIETGLIYSAKGLRYEYDDELDGPQKFSTRYNYIQHPANAIYHFPNTNFLVGLGTYVSYLMSGKTGGDKKVKIDLEGTRRFDAGGTILVGYSLTNQLSAQISMENGIIGLGKDTDSPIKNRSYSFSLIYNFLR